MSEKRRIRRCSLRIDKAEALQGGGRRDGRFVVRFRLDFADKIPPKSERNPGRKIYRNRSVPFQQNILVRFGSMWNLAFLLSGGSYDRISFLSSLLDLR